MQKKLKICQEEKIDDDLIEIKPQAKFYKMRKSLRLLYVAIDRLTSL